MNIYYASQFINISGPNKAETKSKCSVAVSVLQMFKSHLIRGHNTVRQIEGPRMGNVGLLDMEMITNVYYVGNILL